MSVLSVRVRGTAQYKAAQGRHPHLKAYNSHLLDAVEDVDRRVPSVLHPLRYTVSQRPRQ